MRMCCVYKPTKNDVTTGENGVLKYIDLVIACLLTELQNVYAREISKRRRRLPCLQVDELYCKRLDNVSSLTQLLQNFLAN